MRSFSWGVPVEGLAVAVVEFGSYEVEVIGVVAGEVGGFREGDLAMLSRWAVNLAVAEVIIRRNRRPTVSVDLAAPDRTTTTRPPRKAHTALTQAAARAVASSAWVTK